MHFKDFAQILGNFLLHFRIFYFRLNQYFVYIHAFRDGSRTPAVSKIEFFVILVKGWNSFTDVTKSFILDVAGVLYMPLWVFDFFDRRIKEFDATLKISIIIVPRAPKILRHIYKKWLLNVFHSSPFPFENSY